MVYENDRGSLATRRAAHLWHPAVAAMHMHSTASRTLSTTNPAVGSRAGAVLVGGAYPLLHVFLVTSEVHCISLRLLFMTCPSSRLSFTWPASDSRQATFETLRPPRSRRSRS